MTLFKQKQTPGKPELKEGSVILFQGDSITDANRDKEIKAAPAEFWLRDDVISGVAPLIRPFPM